MLDAVGGLPQTGRIDEAEEHATHGHQLLNGITCGTGDLADDGPVLIQQGVQQGALTAVRRTYDGHRYALLDGVAVAEAVDQFGTEVHQPVQQGYQFDALRELHVLLTEVQFQFDQCREVDQLLTELFYPCAEASAQLL